MNPLNRVMKGLTVCSTDSKGNCVFSDTARSQGSLLLRSTAVCAVVADHLVDSRCHICLNTLKKPLLCGGCRFTVFCGQSCLRKAKSVHPLECAFLASEKEVRAEIRLLLRLIAMREDVQSDYKECFHLVSHREKIQESHLNAYKAMVSTVVDEMDTKCTVDECLDMFLRILHNCHSVTLPDKTVIGLALYPSASMVNHSCAPNAVLSFKETFCGPPVALFHAIRRIESEEEIVYSYINLYQSTRERRKDLEGRYHFHCECRRCVDENDEDEFISSVNGDTCLVQSFIEDSSAFDRVLGEIAGSDDFADRLDAMEEWMESLSASHFLKVSLRLTQMSLYRRYGQWKNLESVCRDLLKVLLSDTFRVVKEQPEVALVYENMGVALKEQENSEWIEWVQKALNTRKVCFGRDAVITRETEKMLPKKGKRKKGKR